MTYMKSYLFLIEKGLKDGKLLFSGYLMDMMP